MPTTGGDLRLRHRSSSRLRCCIADSQFCQTASEEGLQIPSTDVPTRQKKKAGVFTTQSANSGNSLQRSPEMRERQARWRGHHPRCLRRLNFLPTRRNPEGSGEREVTPPRLHTTGIFLTFSVGIPRRETVVVGPRPKMRMNKKSRSVLLEDRLMRHSGVV